ncbi:hypothetical protein FSP39_010724 [Pinctada imbricata]|uniref:WD repeat-containing protein 36 n=1 Tax=Pinctada imbricata TaxID=66713 RepID=A0AA89BWT9_PINIB|nr:hypothetical protein FSP39_010724 [Pinctada imbricata]
MSSSSKIFHGYRALGFVSDHVPLSLRHHKKHKENYVITCVGKSFHTYNCSRLGIVSVSDSHPENISCLATDANLVFTGCNNVIRAYRKGRQEGKTGNNNVIRAYRKGRQVNNNVIRANRKGRQVNNNVIRAYRKGRLVNNNVIRAYRKGRQVNNNVIRAYRKVRQVNSNVIRAYRKGRQVNSNVIRAYRKGRLVNNNILRAYRKGRQVNNDIRAYRKGRQVNNNVIRAYRKGRQVNNKVIIADRKGRLVNNNILRAYRKGRQVNNVIRAYRKGRQVVHTYEGHDKDIHILLPFGNHLISVDTDSKVIIWYIENESIYLEMQFGNNHFQITALMHPSTYLNKVVLGSKQGELQLWNILKDKLLYTFPGWGSPVTVIEQSPAVDVVAIGLARGDIILHNLKFDESIVKFSQDWGPVTAISFRTDGHPVMVTGSSSGHIALWNLEDRKLQSQMRCAHGSAVSGMRCLPSEPLMVTSSADNTLKVWIFDLPDGGGRLLRQRAGHSAPPNRLRHYGNNGHNILSAGQDSTLQSFSTQHDKHNKSLGRASYNKSETKKSGLLKDKHMMPPITDFTAEVSRQSDWDNIVACHRGLSVCTTWSYQRGTMGHHRLHHPRFIETESPYQSAVAKAVAISSCGNFSVIGYSSGHVDMFNLQSGIYRGSYGDPAAHECAVRGVATDGLNQITVTAGADGRVKFWRFKRKELLETVKLSDQISHILLHRESSMLAVALDDFQVFIIDLDTRRVVRRFTGHKNAVTDMTFSPDARWLITSSMDSTVRVWDMPTGYLVDIFLLDSAVTSLSMSPTGDFLTTCHVDDVGVYLWSNMTLYSHVPLKQLPPDYEPVVMEMPSTKRRSEQVDETVDEEEEDYCQSEFKSLEQISDELVTLSLLPKSRWHNLLNLDIVKMRNKPKEPPRVPKAAPFFLPTVAGLEPTFVTEKEDNKKSEKGLSHIAQGDLMPLSDLGKILSDGTECKYQNSYVLERLMELGPSVIDVQIRSLSPEGGGSVDVMVNFLRFIHYIIRTKRHFELANAYLGLFIKVHGDVICCEPRVVQELQSLHVTQTESWERLQQLFTQNLCLVNYLRTVTL